MNMFWINVVDATYRPLDSANVRAIAGTRQSLDLKFEDGHWVGHADPGTRIVVHAHAEGFEPESHAVTLRNALAQIVVGLRKPGQLSYVQGDCRLAFAPRDDAFLARVRGAAAVQALPRLAKKLKLEYRPASPRAVPDDDMFVRVTGSMEQARQLAAELKRAKVDIEIARLIEHGDRLPLGLSNELVVRFVDDVKRDEADRLAAQRGLKITRPLLHAGNAFVLAASEPEYALLEDADALAASPRVVYAEPNLMFAIEADAYTPNDTLWAQVPHLQLVDADEGWDLLDNVDVNLRGGSPDITIGVIDLNGVTPNHPDLTATLTDGTGKLVSSTNFAASPVVAQTVAGLTGDHGTQCAGSATAAFDDNRGLPGVAPNCHLIGARIGGASNAVLMADIYMWVGGFLNGSATPGVPAAVPARAADVISSSWGSTGLALSNTIRDCFDFLTTYGRAGKGCVLCFSLGNSGFVDFTSAAGGAFRAWPTYEKTIAVGASINTNPTNPVPVSVFPDENGNTMNIATAVDRRALYSPFGATALRKPDLVAPAHTAYDGAGALVDPVLSCVRVGTGGVNGCPMAPACNDYGNTFGGTSHATPTVAGAVALILSARPGLNWVQVRDILRASCVRIDSAQANVIGAWQDLDGDGAIDYSRWYGAGRLDVDAALALALDDTRALADVYVRENLADTGAVPSTGSWWESPDIWVRQDASTAIPALAWGSAPPHENARRGQDNAVFCRVRNRGTAPASSVYLRAMITHWAGLEFVYSQDFEPSTNVGAPLPNPLTPGTYLIGEARIDNLGVGADQIVKFVWPQAMIPPENVLVGSTLVHWHPCLLVEASPHDGPTPAGGIAVPVQGDNNIAQRNITILNAGDSNADAFVGMVAGTRLDVGIATLVIDARRLRGATAIRLHVADKAAMKGLWEAARRVLREAEPADGDDGGCAVVIETRARLRVPSGDCSVVIEAAPGSRVLCDCAPRRPPGAAWVEHHGLPAIELTGLAGQIEIPLRLAGARFATLLVAATGEAKGDLRITQRRGDGAMSAGYGIRWR
jgi:subtilisin family serine protease